MKKEELDTPALIVDLDAMEHNISDMSNFAKSVGIPLRPMTKTHKCPAIAHIQLEAGSRGIQVAKLSEGEVMAAFGVKDIFISTEVIGAQKVERLIRLSKWARIRSSVDSIEGARGLSELAERRGVKLNVLIDVDTGLGRTGVLPGKPVAALAKEVAKLKGINFLGIFTHEGSVYRASNPTELEQFSVRAAQAMVDSAREIEREGIPVEEVSLGSTPGAKFVTKVKGVTELRPGAYVFQDVMQYMWYQVCNEQDLALSVLTTVISTPSDTRAICDSGSKSAGPDACGFGTFRPPTAPAKMAVVRTLEGEILDDVTFDSTIGEEYGMFKLAGKHKPKIGEKYELVPIHCCGTVHLFDQIYGLRDGEVELTWPISCRGKFT